MSEGGLQGMREGEGGDEGGRGADMEGGEGE